MRADTKKITLNYIYNLSYQIFSLLVPLVTTPYISRALGAEMIGIYGYTLSISTYFIVAGSLGFPLYGQREIAYRAGDVRERSILFFQIVQGQFLLLTAALVLYFAFVFCCAGEYREVYLAQSVGIMGGVLAVSWFYTGIEEFKVTVAKNFLVKALSVLGLFLFVKKPEDVALYAAIVGAANLTGNAAILFDIRKYVDFQQSFRKTLTHVKPAFLLGIPYYITSIYKIIDTTMLGILGDGYAEVGYYEQAQKVVALIMTVITSLGTVIMPRMAQEIGAKNVEGAKGYLNRGIEVSLLLAMPMAAGSAAVASTLVPWFFGAGYERVTGLLVIFAPMGILMGISNLAGSQYMVASQREKELTLTILLGVLVNGVFNALLIPGAGSYGAAATVISEAVKTLVQVAVTHAVDLKRLLRNVLRFGGMALFMGAALLVLKRDVLQENNIQNTLFMTICGAGIYLMLMAVLGGPYGRRLPAALKKRKGKDDGTDG